MLPAGALISSLMLAAMRPRKKSATRSILQGSIKLHAKRLQMVAALVGKDGRSADRVSFYAMDA